MSTLLELVGQQAVSVAVAAIASYVVGKMQSKEEVEKIVNKAVEDAKQTITAENKSAQDSLRSEIAHIKEESTSMKATLEKVARDTSNAVKSEEFDRFVSDNTEKWMAVQNSLGFIKGLLQNRTKGE